MTASAPSEGATIQVSRNGPYLVSGTFRLIDSHGQEAVARSKVALCRCGNSSTKPLCDGTHAKIGFDGMRLIVDATDSPEAYRGKRITIHDNRAICAHAGVCTDNLATVFRLGQEPWINPHAADTEAIIEVVQRCPSGALSYVINGVPSPVKPREKQIAVSKNGPYLVEGDVELKTDGAKPFAPGRYTLCRCGGSKNKPFCDGTHWTIGFDDSRARQAGAFVPPLGLKRFSVVAGSLLVAGVAATVVAIEAAGTGSSVGLFGPNTLIPDLNLLLQLLLVAGLTFGYWLARRGNIAAHRCNQTVWVLLNAVLVALIMVQSMENAALESAADLAKMHIWLPWLHAALGTATVACGLWLVLQMNGILPRPLHVRGWKTLMRVTLAGYWLVALSGLALYYVWFIR